MQRISQEQDSCKRRVSDAQDLSELHAIHRDLQRLTQRQLELSDEQAAVLESLSASSPKNAVSQSKLDLNIKFEPDSISTNDAGN